MNYKFKLEEIMKSNLFKDVEKDFLSILEDKEYTKKEVLKKLSEIMNREVH